MSISSSATNTSCSKLIGSSAATTEEVAAVVLTTPAFSKASKSRLWALVLRCLPLNFFFFGIKAHGAATGGLMSRAAGLATSAFGILGGGCGALTFFGTSLTLGAISLDLNFLSCLSLAKSYRLDRYSVLLFWGDLTSLRGFGGLDVLLRYVGRLSRPEFVTNREA